MTPNDVVLRARACLGKRCRYRLGAGGVNPRALVPWNESLECDCSGFALWALGLSRALWYDTTRIAHEAREGAERLFIAVPMGLVEPGDLLVYGDRRGADAVEHQGHVGVVTVVAQSGAPPGPVFVVHCSSGNWKRYGDAIYETGPEAWMKDDAVAARCLRLSRVA